MDGGQKGTAITMDHSLTGKPLSGVELLVATPCHDGRVTEGYLRSVVSASHMIRTLGGGMELCTPAGESLITRARNGLLAYFIAQKKFTHLLFIDSDLHFNPQLIVRLIQSGHSVAAGCYPLKDLDIGRVRESSASTQTNEEVVANSLTYCFTAQTDADDIIQMDIEDGFCKVDDVGTGLMIINRECVNQMCASYPELHCENGSTCWHDHIHPQLNDNFWLFFETSYDPKSKRYLSEDYHFCKLWREAGGEVWMDVTQPMTHTGIMEYRGNVAMALEFQTEEVST